MSPVLDPLGTPCRRIKQVGKILSLVHHLAVPSSSCLAASCFVDRSAPQLAGEPVIDTELSRTGADQPEKEEHVQCFRNVEEIVEPFKWRTLA